MTGKDRPPGIAAWGPADTSPAECGSATMLVPGADPNPVAVMGRRRRAASWRLPPLASGHRDPLDAPAGLPVPDRNACCRGQFGAGGKWQPCCRR